MQPEKLNHVLTTYYMKEQGLNLTQAQARADLDLKLDVTTNEEFTD